MPAPLDDRRKKLHFRAWRRGFREIDLILGRFADSHLATLDETGLNEFEALLGVPDQIAYAWIVGQEKPAPAQDTATLALIRRFHQIEKDP